MKRVPYVAQMEMADCGAACLAMVLAYQGRQVPLRQVRDAAGTGPRGLDAQDLVDAADAFGLTGRGVQADVDDLALLPQASILHWEFDHFVVFERVTRRGVDIIDPAAGRRRVPLSRFRRSYTGIAVVFEPTGAFQPLGQRRRVARLLVHLVRGAPGLVRVALTSLLLRLLALAFPVLTGVLVDRVIPAGNRELLVVLSAAFAVVVAQYFLVEFIRAHLLLRLRTVVDWRLSTAFLDHLVDLPYSFFLSRTVGDLMARQRSNIMLRELVTTATLSTLIDGLLVTSYLLLLAFVSAELALTVVVVAVAQVLVLVATHNRTRQVVAESLRAEADSQGYLYQLLAGIETLKSAGAEHRALRHWSNLFVEEVNAIVARGRLSALTESVLAALRLGGPIAVLTVGGAQVLSGGLSLGTMLAAVALAAGALEPLASFVATGLQLQLLPSYLDRITDVLDTPREQDGRRTRPAPDLTGHIVADAVSFSYRPAAEPVVDDVSLEVTPGQYVAIVGPSGSGKSTLARLLLGLYQPSSGRILLDGIDVCDLEARSVRRQLGIVTQDASLFGLSIRENLSLSRPGAPIDDLHRAARLACIHEDILAMPMGYETPMGDAGRSLSGGQRQRLALARALVHEPAILLLDEATSALDTVTEARIYDNLRSLDATAIVIAHRLSTVVKADAIVVMERGRLVQTGTHDELLAVEGLYRHLVAHSRVETSR